VSHIFQPRRTEHGGKGVYLFRITVPKELRITVPKELRDASPHDWRRKRQTVKSLETDSDDWRYKRQIVESLGTDSAKEAERLARQRRADWEAIFTRAKNPLTLTLGEVEDHAREVYTATAARLALEGDPDDAIWLPSDLAKRSKALEEGDVTLAIPDIEAIERRTGIKLKESPIFKTLALAVLRAQEAAYSGRLRALQGIPSERPLTFLGAAGIDPFTYQPAKLDRPGHSRSGQGPVALFEAWASDIGPAASTVNRWRTIFVNLQSTFGDSEISERAAHEWLHSLKTEERTAVTVNLWRKAAKRIYKWATTERLVSSNPFANLEKVDGPKKPVTRDRAFTPDEAKIILGAAAKTEVKSPFSAAQHWCPWLQAYSGARGGEVTQLRGMDIEKRDGFHIMRITPDAGTTKTNTFREVPLHDHLIALGFLEFVKSRGAGPLFYEAAKTKRPRSLKTRERLAAWVRELGVKEKGVSPTHGWRHTFKAIAERSGISERISDAITGHAPTTSGRGYGRPTVADMAGALKNFPRFEV
jgi:integrase